MQVKKTAEMFNFIIKEHLSLHPKCHGLVEWDMTAEEKRGLGWRERGICHNCDYKSKMFNLYNEVDTGKRGRKAADINQGLSVGMTQTPIGAAGLRKVLLSSNIPPPSVRGIQYTTNRVADEIQCANKSDMHLRRCNLKNIKKMRGSVENVIDVESDGMYNNALYSGVGKTPFQPATQCSYIMAENVTTKRQIIAVETVNKLCSKHGMHTKLESDCNIQSGECSSNTFMEETIGNEQKWAKRCLVDLKKDNLEVKHITTDSDTSAYRAAEELYEDSITATEPEHLLDTRHLTNNHRKFIRGCDKVLAMMPGGTKAHRDKLRNRFSSDLSMRCQAEFTNVFQQENGDPGNMLSRMTGCTDAMILCYAGDHTLCAQPTTMCKGREDDNWLKRSDFLPDDFRIDIEKAQNKLTLIYCIDYRIRPEIIQKTKLNTNSQKVEATNRAIRRSVPRNVTFSRNFPGRVHSAVHSVNNGPGLSISRLCHRVGCRIQAGSRVASGLLSQQQLHSKKQIRERSLKSKVKRKLKRKKLYKLYEKHHEEIAYAKDKLMNERYQLTRKKHKDQENS